ncbi:hybrid sensor histidine kinase/response regulator transcription factor [Flavihumibacter petaseus]|uniref:histidine kinase n=1 Tax=Flavihumibacter petaseus NBRC 106054 TaxID=1220578 RepID=A0A0E9N6L0_9BACT|nr:hybrid sensor histidine kinase/response regulator transcription factor [Flavihumibacter petaseus]GAO45454.1 putative two-component hybrid sensor and regulator [Flavihumibacter petaseus NBRC 106054]
MRVKLFSSCIIFFLGLQLLQAQPYYFKNYQVNQGLSSNTVTSITQDKNGFMWFGTRNGLNRFDGGTFRVFRYNDKDSKSIGSNSILSLYANEDKSLWVGTYKGIYAYDPHTETFSTIPQLPPGEIRAIKGNGDHVWIISDYHLFEYNKKHRTTTSLESPNTETVALSVAPDGTMWSATGEGMIKKYNAVTKSFTAFNLPSLYKAGPVTRIQEIYTDTDSTMLIGTINQLFLFNVKTNTLTDLLTVYNHGRPIQTHSIIRHGENVYWIGAETGLYILDLNRHSLYHMQKEANDPYAITDNVVYSFCRDSEGSVWIGTFFGGINYYSQQNNRFKKYFQQSSQNRISGNLVHEICEDDYNNLWVGTEDAGLNKINRVTGQAIYYRPGGPGSISYTNIHGLIADRNELWIGTYEHGLDVMDIPSGKVIRHYSSGTGPHELKSNFIVSMYKTRDNDILVGTWYGLFRYDRAANNFIPHSFFNTQIQAVHESNDGTLWICSYGKGVYYYNAAKRDSGRLQFDAANSNSLSNNYVNNLFEDSRRNLWFCTESGLCKYAPATGKFTRYGIENGLPDNQVFRVLEDKHGNLWISTAKGLVLFNEQEQYAKTFTTTNGLPTDQFNYNSAFADAKGNLFFGTAKGMISFNPGEFTKSTFVPPVYVTGLHVNNKSVPIGDKSSPLQQSISFTRKLSLPYEQSSINLDVAALSYVTPEMNEFSYKMEGLDKDWVNIKNNHTIYFNKLPPGHYVLRLKGAAGGEVWNPQETVVDITILHPWWANTWAYITYALIGLAIIFTIMKYYLLAVNEQNKRKFETLEIEKEREIYNAKIEFFTNIAHEIRTPLTLIKLPLDKLIGKANHNAEDIANLNMMKKNTNRLIDLTDQLLDFRKAEANKFSLTFIRTDINDILKDFFISFKPVAEQKDISMKLELPRFYLQAYVDPEAFRKILSNLFNNAIKYAEKSIVIRLLPFSSNDTFFTIEIRNDGYLIPYELKEKIFEPFYRIGETAKQTGTGLGLPLSRSLAELHKGVLDLKQPEGNMNVFQLSLPIHQDKEIDLYEYETFETGDTREAVTDEPLHDNDKPHLLIVEDNREIATFLRNELQAQYNITRAGNGQEALDIIDRENYQLIISDIMMPVMDGIEFCKTLKTDLRYSHIPIILLTAKNTTQSKIEGLETGADAYMEKPFAFEHLQAQINNLINNRKIIKEFFARSPLTHIRGMASSKADKEFLEQLNQVIYDNITDMDLNVDKLSKMMNISRPTLYRKINAISDLTPNELINVTRLKRAAELLADGRYKINEVSSMVGYTLPSNFARDFNKQFGVTPSAYVNSLEKESK